MANVIQAKAKLTRAKDIVEENEKFILLIHPSIQEARQWLAYMKYEANNFTMNAIMEKIRDAHIAHLEAAIKAYDAAILDVQYWTGYVMASEDVK